MKIAFIGLGNMGGGMAANLVKARHAVNTFDLSDEALSRAQMLKGVYEELWQQAADEDREKASLRIAPRVALY